MSEITHERLDRIIVMCDKIIAWKRVHMPTHDDLINQANEMAKKLRPKRNYWQPSLRVVRIPNISGLSDGAVNYVLTEALRRNGAIA